MQSTMNSSCSTRSRDASNRPPRDISHNTCQHHAIYGHVHHRCKHTRYVWHVYVSALGTCHMVRKGHGRNWHRIFLPFYAAIAVRWSQKNNLIYGNLCVQTTLFMETRLRSCLMCALEPLSNYTTLEVGTSPNSRASHHSAKFTRSLLRRGS